VRSEDLSAARKMAMSRLRARSSILVRLPPACLAAVEPRTDQVLSLDCCHCPYVNDAELGGRQQQETRLDKPPLRVRGQCWPRPPTVRFYVNCRHLAALPRTAAACQNLTHAAQKSRSLYSMTSSARRGRIASLSAVLRHPGCRTCCLAASPQKSLRRSNNRSIAENLRAISEG
jgi:hypothetical protein